MKHATSIISILALPLLAAAQNIGDTNLTAADVDSLIEGYETSLPFGVEQQSETIEFVIEAEDSITIDQVEQAMLDFQQDLVDYAKQHIGTPYKWGATGPRRFDCSGFTSYIFKNFGIDIGRTSRIQSARGEKIELDDVRVGDLMFFSRPSGGKTVGHVGMVVDVQPTDGTLKFIHASSSKGVTISDFPDNGYFNRRFLHVRRVV